MTFFENSLKITRIHNGRLKICSMRAAEGSEILKW